MEMFTISFIVRLSFFVSQILSLGDVKILNVSISGKLGKYSVGLAAKLLILAFFIFRAKKTRWTSCIGSPMLGSSKRLR